MNNSSNKTIATFLSCGWNADRATMEEAICAFFHDTDQLGRLAEWLKASAPRANEPFDMVEMQGACRLTAKILCEHTRVQTSIYHATLQRFEISDDDDEVWIQREALLKMQTMFLILRGTPEFRDLFSVPTQPGFRANAMLREYLYRT